MLFTWGAVDVLENQAGSSLDSSMHRYRDWREIAKIFYSQCLENSHSKTSPSSRVDPFIPANAVLTTGLISFNLAWMSNFLTFPLCRVLIFAKKTHSWWCGLGLVLTLGPAWLWVNNLLAAIHGLPLIQIYGTGTGAKGAPHLQQGSLTPIPVPCRKILQCCLKCRIFLYPATRNVSRHCLTPA